MSGIRIGAAFIEVTADTSKAEHDVKSFGNKVNGEKVSMNVGADTGVAAQRISFLARDRFVNMNVKVNGLAVAGAALAKLSGGDVLGKSLSNVGDALSNLGTSTPKIAGLSMAIGSLAAAGLAGTSNLLTLGGSIASVAGAGIALPGLLAGAAVGAGVLIAALKDAPTVLASLGPQFTNLQKSISSNFWGQAAQPIKDLTNNLLPSLSGGLNQVANDMGASFGIAATSLQSALGGGVLDGMMSNLSIGIQVASQAIQPLVQAFTTLGTIGSQYIPGLAAGFADISAKFNTFIQGAAADGSLKGWIDGGIGALKQLGSIVGSVGSILGSLYSAASAAGGSSLQTLAAGLSGIAAVVSGPAFQGALTTIFSGAANGMNGLLQALAPIGNMFVALAPTISMVLNLLGSLAGQVLGTLATALSDPSIAIGLQGALTGIMSGVQAILPSVPALAQAFGALMSTVGTLAAVIGPVLGAAISTLAPVLTQLLPVLQPLILALGGALMQAIVAVSPFISALVPIVGQLITSLVPLVSTIMAMLIPALTQILTAVMPVISTLADLLIPVINMLLPVVSVVFSAIAAVVTSVMPIIQGIIEVVTGVISGNWDQVWNGILKVIGGVWDTIVSLIGGALDILGSIIGAALGMIGSLIGNAFDGMMSFIGDVWNNIVNLISDAWNGISGAVSSGVNDMMGFVSGIPDQIMGFLGNMGGLLVDSGAALIQGFIDGIKGMIGGIGDAVGGIMDFASSFFPHSPAERGAFSGKGWTPYSGAALSQGFADGIASKAGDVKAATESLMGMAGGALGDINGNVTVGSTAAQSGLAGSSKAPTNTGMTHHGDIYVTIDAKNVKDFNSVVDIMNNISQTARTGRGAQNVRVA